MRLRSAIPWWQRVFPGWKRTQWLRLLQQQRSLLHTGMDANAEIMHTIFFEERIGNLLPVKLWVKLKKADGSFIYTHTITLVNYSFIPDRGETVKVKYQPSDLSAILILS